MAITLNLTWSGCTATLNSASAELADYAPLAPALPPDQMARVLWAHPNSQTLPLVTESAVVYISASSIADLNNAVRSVENIFYGANLRAYTPSACRAFVKFAPDGGSTFRSELMGGRLDLDKRALAYPNWTSNRTIRATLAWTRMPYWEDDTERQLPLWNSAGSSLSPSIANCDDGSRDNYVEIAGSNACGLLPAPIRLSLTNNGASAAARRYYIGHKALGGGASAFTHTLEAESATLNASYSVSASDANSSNGSRVNVSALPSSVASLLSWTIGETQVGYITNNWMRFVARFAALPSTSSISLRTTLKDALNGVIVSQSDYVSLSASDALQVVSTMLVAPNSEGRVTSGSLKVVLEGKDANSGSFGLDFIQMLPAEAGRGFRYLRPVDESASGVAVSGGVIVDNGLDGGLYLESRQTIYQGYGSPVMLLPGLTQRIIVLHDKLSGCAPIAATTTVSVYTRPRRLTV